MAHFSAMGAILAERRSRNMFPRPLHIASSIHESDDANLAE
ncbi:hypothetical protein MITSMUL_05248 [Mitsuokella multacida DSM 20544]|uniref:Uncharacterized protein n=1 Tax=Mitsuokella multacida DSM 20544 TaxID=500635 RepID=C9KPU0_9FIRM|nr:hypothetical protein MITSMUL_05248 [Mitsuokella multacida DSM 20544]